MKNIDALLKEYGNLDISLSLEEEKDLLYRYVFATNRLEGNQLTLVQTAQLLSTDTLSGNNIRTPDILEQKGMYKALVRMLRAVREKEQLSVELLLELNWLSIGHLWKYDDAYIDAKQKGQKEGGFKVSKNLIRISRGNKAIERIEPLSDPKSVRENMEKLIKTVSGSDKHVIVKAAFLAQELWLHQPFVDENKRTGRLAINFLTMKKGYPLLVFDDKNKNYNSLLVEQYLEKKPNLIVDYIGGGLTETMKKSLKIKNSKGSDRGYRMIL